MQYIIGIDIGTSGTKALALTREGGVLQSAYESYPIISISPEQQELDPDTLLRALINTVRKLLTQMDGKDRVAALSFSCAMHSVIAVDKRGSALTRAITWADLRSREFASQLKGTETGNRIYEHTGTPIHAMSPLCKIMWLKEKQPGIFDQAAKFISIKEYIWFQFFGKYQVDYSIASATGLFDIRALTWYAPALLTAGIGEDRLSLPVPPTHIETDLNRGYQNRLGLLENTPFVIGGNDGCLANLGTGAVVPGEMALTIGTSAAVRIVSAKPIPDLRQRVFNYILTEGLYVCGGAVNNGGNVVKWYMENFMEGREGTGNDLNSMIEELSVIGPGSGGLIFLPYLFGERAPIWDADARAVFFGIHSGHGSRHFLRSIIEGIGFALYQISLSFEELVSPIQKIYASGGFIQSGLWLQLIADIFNKPVLVTNIADASAVGAAIMGWHALGLVSRLDEPIGLTKLRLTLTPDEDRHAIYMKNYSVYSVLYDQLKADFFQMSR
jgi:gluconokinase